MYDSDDDGRQYPHQSQYVSHKSGQSNSSNRRVDDQHEFQSGAGTSAHGNQSSRSYDSIDQKSTKKEMIRYLSRILDRNKPLFVFNTRLGNNDSGDGLGNPSFSMITLIHENE